MRRLLLLATLLAPAQSKPDFSGTWAINLAASDYSDSRARKPENLSFKIQQKNERFKYKVESVVGGKKHSFDVDVEVGGPAFESDPAGIVSMEWKGQSLIVSTLYNPGQDRQSDQVETWTLSPDGKRLNDELIYHLPQNKGSVRIVRIFDKQ